MSAYSERIARYYEIPKELWKEYIVYYKGGVESSALITAPNKTMARLFFNGTFNSYCKITKIKEVFK